MRLTKWIKSWLEFYYRYWKWNAWNNQLNMQRNNKIKGNLYEIVPVCGGVGVCWLLLGKIYRPWVLDFVQAGLSGWFSSVNLTFHRRDIAGSQTGKSINRNSVSIVSTARANFRNAALTVWQLGSSVARLLGSYWLPAKHDGGSPLLWWQDCGLCQKGWSSTCMKKPANSGHIGHSMLEFWYVHGQTTHYAWWRYGYGQY